MDKQASAQSMVPVERNLPYRGSMDIPYCKELSEAIRRVAQRGKVKAERELESRYIDLFQHLLDNNVRLHNELEKS